MRRCSRLKDFPPCIMINVAGNSVHKGGCSFTLIKRFLCSCSTVTRTLSIYLFIDAGWQAGDGVSEERSADSQPVYGQLCTSTALCRDTQLLYIFLRKK